MNRHEFVRRFVLMEIADDYENLVQIHAIVAEDSSRCGMTVTAPEMSKALVELIEAGLAKAYRLSTTPAPAREVQGVPALGEFEDYYTHFWATPHGKELLHSDRDWWPFDDEGELRGDWKPPEN